MNVDPIGLRSDPFFDAFQNLRSKNLTFEDDYLDLRRVYKVNSHKTL